MTHPLQAYISASGDTLAAFAERAGVSQRSLARILSGGEAPEPDVARRVVEATGGAVSLAVLYGASDAEIADLSLRQRGDGLDIELLAPVLRYVLKSVAGPGAVISSEVIGAAAEAVANTHDALARVTTRRGADRLVQALRPVLGEIQRDYPELGLLPERLDDAAALAGDLYCQAKPLLEEA